MLKHALVDSLMLSQPATHLAPKVNRRAWGTYGPVHFHDGEMLGGSAAAFGIP